MAIAPEISKGSIIGNSAAQQAAVNLGGISISKQNNSQVINVGMMATSSWVSGGSIINNCCSASRHEIECYSKLATRLPDEV